MRADVVKWSNGQMVKPKKHKQQEKEVVEKEVEVEDRTGIGRRLKELDDTLRCLMIN